MLRKTTPSKYTPTPLLDAEDVINFNTSLGEWRNDVNAMEPIAPEAVVNRAPEGAISARDVLCDYFMDEGAVPWQERMCFM